MLFFPHFSLYFQLFFLANTAAASKSSCSCFCEILCLLLLHEFAGGSTIKTGFSFDSDDKQQATEMAATRVVETTQNQQELNPTAQPDLEDTSLVDDSPEQEINPVGQQSKRRRDLEDPTSEEPWSFSFDPVLPSQKCFSNYEFSHTIGYRSHHPVDVELVKSKTGEEVADEYAFVPTSLRCSTMTSVAVSLKLAPKSETMMPSKPHILLR